MANYATLSDVKAAARIDDNVDDSLLNLCIEASSREIDGYCERDFTSGTATRVFTPQDAFVTQIDDLVSLTTLKTSSDGTSYDVTWSASDYQLEPLNGRSSGLEHPYTRIRAIGSYLFPIWDSRNVNAYEATVQVTGVWGWPSVPVAVKQATILLSLRQFRRYDSPLGATGFGDLGVIRVGRVDPDVQKLLDPYRKVLMA